MQHMVAALGATMERGPLSIAHLGGGLCSLPCALAEHYPRSRQLVIEADARLASEVRKWVSIPRSPQVRIRAGLAQDILPTLPDAGFDAVIRDAFIGAQVPPELASDDAARQVCRILKDDGVYLANVVDEPGLAKVKAEVRVLREHFADLVGIAEPAVWRGRRRGNVVIIAANRLISTDALHREMRAVPFPARIIPRRELLAKR